MKNRDRNVNGDSLKEGIEKAESIMNRSWDSADSLNPHLDALASILSATFDMGFDGRNLFEVAVMLENEELLESGISDLVAELEYELEDSYGEDWEFESDYLFEVCKKIITSLRAYV